MTTIASLIDPLRALSTDLVTVTAIERDGQIVASYRVHSDDIDAAETIGAQVSREIGEAMRRAGWRFVDAGGDDPGVFEIWVPIPTRPVTVAIDTACRHGGEPLIWGVAEGDDHDAAVSDAAQWLAEGDACEARHRRAAAELDVVTIQWPAGEKLPDGQDRRAIALALKALA